MSDPQKYRTKDEVEDYKQKDPITQVLKTIEDNKLASEKEIKEIQDEVKQIVENLSNLLKNLQILNLTSYTKTYMFKKIILLLKNIYNI